MCLKHCEIHKPGWFATVKTGGWSRHPANPRTGFLFYWKNERSMMTTTTNNYNNNKKNSSNNNDNMLLLLLLLLKLQAIYIFISTKSSSVSLLLVVMIQIKTVLFVWNTLEANNCSCSVCFWSDVSDWDIAYVDPFFTTWEFKWLY